MNMTPKSDERAYKEQGGVQVSDVFGNYVVIMFVSHFLVGSPKVCGRIGFGLRRFQIRNRVLKPKEGTESIQTEQYLSEAGRNTN